jgi:DamX protein
MAASELNNRLDYLISYSSQLVFVCSDKISRQSQVVESFLAHQNEQADLALLTANELTPLVTYREKLFRQLINQNQKADFNRPLNQLLAPLNNHSGPILINVFHAERLPDKLVKELWDLVLQSRFANNKQHLNVLLMGHSDWAESAKAGLGSSSKEQPIVLNSHIEIQQTEIEEFPDLEAFIQDKREKFAQRLEERQLRDDDPAPIYKNGWMATLFGLAFLAIFSGILGWQYPEKTKEIIAYINHQLSKPVELLKASDFTNFVDAEPVKNAKSLTQLNNEIADSSKTPSASTNVPIVQNINRENVLVTDWATAIAKLDEQSNKILLQTNDISEANDIQTTLSKESKPLVKIPNLGGETEVLNDYKIEDNVELATLLEPEELFVDNLEPSQSDEFLSPKPELILALPTKNYVIQLAAMANPNILKKFINEEQLGQQLWLYKTQRYGSDWFVLLNNQHFPSIEAARAEIVNLAEPMRKNNPFVKSIAQVKQEIAASGT